MQSGRQRVCEARSGETPRASKRTLLMLEGIRRASQNWLGKIVVGILFSFLVLSFAVWGIGDIFRGFGVGTVAKVGETDVTTEAFRNAYQKQLQAWQREARRAITNDEARAAGLDRMVLSRLISEAALDQRVRALGLAMADKDIAQAIVNDPAFLGPTGRFERQRFNDALREAGYPNEQRFLLEQRMSYLRRELALSIAGEPPIPRVLMEAAHRYGSETRSVEYFRLPESAAGDLPAPSEETLAAFYEQRRSGFRAPEYRAIQYLAVTPASVADPDKVSDEDARKTYEASKQRWSLPERRSVQQIVFPTQDEAAAVRKRIAEGLTFDELAAERKLSEQDISLGTLAWADFVDPNVAQAAFALEAGATSDPVAGAFGFALLRVTKIEPQSVSPFEQVVGNVKRDIATRRAGDDVRAIRDKIEDARTAGRTLAEAAKTVGLAAAQAELDNAGRDRAGAPALTLAERDNLLRAVFASDIGVDNDVVTTRDGGYIWFEVSAIDPARDRALAEVRERVVAAWRSDEIARILQEKAAGFVKRIEAGESLDAVAKEAGVAAEFDNEVRRIMQSRIPGAVVQRVFSVRVGQTASAPDGDARVVFRVLDSAVPAYDPEAPGLKGLEPQLRTAMTEDILAQYIARVQDELGVSINEAAVRLAVGGSDQN